MNSPAKEPILLVNVVCEPLAKRPLTDVPCEKEGSYVRIYNFRLQDPLSR